MYNSLNETVDEVLKDLKSYRNRSLERIIKKVVLGSFFVGSFGLGLYLEPDKEENEYFPIYNTEAIAGEKSEEKIKTREENKLNKSEEKIYEITKEIKSNKSEEKNKKTRNKVSKVNSSPGYYYHPLYEENSRKIEIIKGKNTQRVDIRQINLARLSIMEKNGYNYHLPSVNFTDLSYRIITHEGVKTYNFGKNGISEPIPNEELAARLIPGDILYSADLMNSHGNFPFTAVKGKLVLNKEQLDDRKEFYAIARL